MSENHVQNYESDSVEAGDIAANGAGLLDSSNGSFTLPGWADSLKTKRERQLEIKLLELEAERQNLLDQINYLKGDLGNVQWIKALVSSQNVIFEDSVISALKSLGYKACRGPEKHADILAWDSHTLLVVKARGSEGPAKKRDILQCAGWVNEVAMAQLLTVSERQTAHRKYIECLESIDVPIDESDDSEDMVTPRGVLIMNTFCDAPLVERPIGRQDTPDFLDDALVEDNKLLALTGLQLMCMVLASGDDLAQIREIRSRFATQSSVLKEYTDWQSLLDQ